MFIYRKKKSVEEETATEGKKACALQSSGLTVLVAGHSWEGRCAWLWCRHPGDVPCHGVVFCARKVLGSDGVYPLTQLPDS